MAFRHKRKVIRDNGFRSLESGFLSLSAFENFGREGVFLKSYFFQADFLVVIARLYAALLPDIERPIVLKIR